MEAPVLAALIGAAVVVFLAFVKHYRENTADAVKPVYGLAWITSFAGTIGGCLLIPVLFIGLMIVLYIIEQ